MNAKPWHKLWIYVVIPAVMLLYFNQAANWHYHVTDEGIVVQHAHPFANSMIPGTPYQDHEHSDFEYLVLAQLMHTLGLVVMLLVLLGLWLDQQPRKAILPQRIHPATPFPDPNPTRGPPASLA